MCESCFPIFQDTFLLGAGCVGLAVYIVVLVVLIKFSKTTFKRPFFTFCIGLGLVEVVGLVKSIVEPAVMQYLREYPDDEVVRYAYAGLSRLPWYGTLFHQIYIATERLTALCYPKLHEMLWTPKAMCVHFLTMAVITFATNACVFTPSCAHVLYPDGETFFYNMSLPGSLLQNRIVDLGLQPFCIVLVTLIYLISGIKIVRLRRQIRTNLITSTSHVKTNNTDAARKKRIEMMLVLQGFMIATPQTVVMIIYHAFIYIPMGGSVKVIMKLVMDIFSKLVYSASPFFYLFLNTDVRLKLAELLVGRSGRIASMVVNTPATISPQQQQQQQQQPSFAQRDRESRRSGVGQIERA